MATMIKERRKEKKKVKDKNKSQITVIPELATTETQSDVIGSISNIVDNVLLNDTKSTLVLQCSVETPENEVEEILNIDKESKTVDIVNKIPEQLVLPSTSYIHDVNINVLGMSNLIETDISSEVSDFVTKKALIRENSGNKVILSQKNKELHIDNVAESYVVLNKTLDNVVLPKTVYITEERIKELENPDSYLGIKKDHRVERTSLRSQEDQTLDNAVKNPQVIIESVVGVVQEDLMPSAPIFEEEPQMPLEFKQVQEVTPQLRVKVPCISLDEALKVFGVKEIEEVRIMSEREEAIVEEGPVSGPEHPLVDLLSTFRSSLIAVERECINLTCGFADQEKSLQTLWRIEKRIINVTKQCGCGAKVDFKATYEHAELLKERLPVAKLRLEGLLRDVQDSYCHHQHEALLTHCQIDELISETVQSSKADIREALSLILQALRHSDGAPMLLADALQRWAGSLAVALVDKRDMRHLLFLLHHLFRQTRSVQWAVGVINLSVEDNVAAARIIALMDILFARSRLDAAVECTEDTEEVWEEVDRHGDGGAVSEGMMRERDLLALLYAFPLRDLVARLVLFTNADIKQARDYEWGDTYGGRGVFKACCGVRVLLAMLQRASTIHAHYTRLLRALREIAARALLALSCLNLHSRYAYTKEMQIKISTELETVFTSGFVLFGTEDIHRLPATLLTDEAARDYCDTFINGLHEKSSRRIESLSVEMPLQSCDVRVRIIVQAAIDRMYDHELAKTVLEFLFQGIKRKNVQCTGGCDAAAREWMPRLLAVHPYLHTLALHMVAELNQVEAVDPENVKPLSIETWRPTPGEIRAVLEDWSQRATPLLQRLLLALDYTPYTGLPLEVQLTIGSFLCTWVRSSPSNSAQEWCWEVLRKLRVHRCWWKSPLDAPPPEDEPTDNFTTAYTLLATSWGHCMPLICSQGVSALCTLAAVRVRDAIHCLAPIMIVMAHSPESVSLTPKFTELFTIVLNSGPSLVQRALGRGGESGSTLLLQLILKQLENETYFDLRRGSILSTWMHALWRYTLPNSSCAILDTAALACREWPHLDAHATVLLQEENSKDIVTQSVRNASTAPLLCECILRTCHASKESYFYTRLLAVLAQQRANGQRIHVDNALQQIGANLSADELVIYRSAAAAMAAPFHHPSHLALWRLFMHLYLQRPPDHLVDSAVAVGPLFFSGIIKSRTWNHIKKRLQDTATYHYNEVETLKSQHNIMTVTKATGSAKVSSRTVDDGLLSALSINDLTGQSSDSNSESDSSKEENESESRDGKEKVDILKKKSANLLLYHEAAEKLIRQYLLWLEEGDKVKALPHQVDIARFIPQQPLEVSWRHALSISRPSLEVECETPTTPTVLFPPAERLVKTPFQIAVKTITEIKGRSRNRARRKVMKSPLEDVDFKDSRTLLRLVDKHLKNIEKLAQEWCAEVSRISSLDTKLWELVCSLRVPQALPALKKQCPNKCKPITLHVSQEEWCLSIAAERGLKDNRWSSRSCIRRLARPRPHAARTVAALHTIARRIHNSDSATRVLELAWVCAGAFETCAPAQDAITTLTTYLAERWICHEGRLCADLISRWSRYSKNTLQQSQCGAIVSPQKLRFEQWPIVYVALLRAELPQHMLFSYLSKFDMCRWSETADLGARRNILEALSVAIQRWGPNPNPQYHILLDLLEMHTQAVINEVELCAHIIRCARATVNAALPKQHWKHVAIAVERVAGGVPFDQLGHLLRELGVMWWEARTGIKGVKSPELYTPYSSYVARLLNVLLRAFVAAALKLSYAPERVSLYAWLALQESWGAWIVPSVATPPLLPSLAEEEAFTAMLKHFVDTLQQVMLDCPGSEIPLLQHAFEWTIQTFLSVESLHTPQETRVQMSALLAELAKLPWREHQWCYGKCLQAVMQVCTSTDKEITSWCCQTWRNITAETWLSGDVDTIQDQPAPKLASLLYLFTGTHLPHDQRTLEEAVRLPWWRLPEPALGEAMDRFFVAHHNPALPYHELPQFRVILFASELYIDRHTPIQIRTSTHSRQKRCVAVSQLVRAACVPTLTSHLAGHSTMLLKILTQLASCLESSSDEIEELLGRAIQIMCMDAAAAALPVWERWVCNTTTRMVRACVSAAGVLTAFVYFAAIADVAVKTLLNNKDCGGWDEVVSRLINCPWCEPHALLMRGRLHAAYACALTHAHTQDAAAIRRTFSELRVVNINFVENEAIVALWICYACRIAVTCSRESPTEMADCIACINQLVAGWANPPRRSILRVVALQADNDRPTQNHRLICRLAQCILAPNDDSLVGGFESACVGPLSGLGSWGRNPTLGRLVRLTMTLYPQYERYFKMENEIVSRE